jgi:hypothetical protein
VSQIVSAVVSIRERKKRTVIGDLQSVVRPWQFAEKLTIRIRASLQPLRSAIGKERSFSANC